MATEIIIVIIIFIVWTIVGVVISYKTWKLGRAIKNLQKGVSDLESKFGKWGLKKN